MALALADLTELADLALKAGVPTALGCTIVWYLLWRHIPALTRSFEKAIADLVGQNTATREDCAKLLAAQTKASAEAIELLRRQLENDSAAQTTHRSDEATRTRAAVGDLAKQTAALAEAIHRMQGHHDVVVSANVERVEVVEIGVTQAPGGALAHRTPTR